MRSTRGPVLGSYYRGEFDPRSLSGLVGWFKSDVGITVATGVSAWVNLAPTGPGYDVAQGTAGNQPVDNTAGLNGLPYLTFDATDDHLSFSGAGLGMTNAITGFSVFLIAKATVNLPVATPNAFYASRNGNALSARLSIRESTANKFQTGTRCAEADTLTTSTSTASIYNTNQYLSAITNYAANTVSQYINGVLDGTGSASSSSTTITPSSDSLTVRIGSNGDGSATWGGDIYEVVLYNRAITDPVQLKKIHDYLKRRSGL